MYWGLLHHWSFAAFLICCSVRSYGRPVDGINIRVKRAVPEHQFLHDKGKSIQEHRRRQFVHILVDSINTAERYANHEFVHNIKSPSAEKNDTLHTTTEFGGPYSSQETAKAEGHKEQTQKHNGKKKKVKSGKRKEQERKRRRERSVRINLEELSNETEWDLYPYKRQF